SKGVRRKNVRLVGGQPLIAYTIQAAQKSRSITRFITSTDDEEIAAVAESLGCPVLKRSVELAADDTPMVPVVKHALAQDSGSYDYVLLLQPTAPFRTHDDIDDALSELVKAGSDSVVSVYQVTDNHPARMYRCAEGRLVPYEAEPPARLRQGLPPVYHRNGAIYACRRELIDQHDSLTGSDIVPYIMPRERSFNIDDEMDLAFVDYLLSQQRKTWQTRQ
ncbi:MAG: acylneuraminate cytidylyltransferase family protein, partial [Acidobacteria bacterium]|nr:acylneuraminate cytidylyltransferase family protein [Acidobacteriota bacterium]